ncbi:phosphatidylserine decarboxylase [Peribacillus sp. SCS-155]|uniref:phosphatidylserine decarboxylase n=1 Tax=Peribacillus sedimenti TaxID=3115297 RepID=UPI003906103F
MLQPIYRLLIELTNGRIISEALKRFSQSRWSKPLISSYISLFNINKGEIEQDISKFTTLHDLFTRRLKAGARKIDEAENAVVSPVDGVMEDYGVISNERVIAVKGKDYSIGEMLGDDDELKKYSGGSYMVLYLSPSHYHRIHSPVSGKVVKRWVLGKKSYPVNNWGMRYGRQPLSKNYRNISELEHKGTHIAVVKVGAMFVNSIIITDQSKDLHRGQEFAYFSFGSTVVLLFERNAFRIKEPLTLPKDVRVGEVIGFIESAK